MNVANLKEACAKEMNDVIHARRDIREISNIASAYAYAIDELKALPSGTTMSEVDPDWATCFYDSAKNSTDETIQVLWGKILAGEIASKGTYYKRTLSVLKNMEPEEARHFVELVPLLISGEMLPEFILRDNVYYQYNDLQTMMDCGIVNSSDAQYTYHSLNDLKIPGYELISLNNDVKEVYIEGFALTDAGLQLSKLIKCNQANHDYVKTLSDWLSKRNAKLLELRKIIS